VAAGRKREDRPDILRETISMPTIRGCNLPEDLYYLIDKHVWARPMQAGSIRVGMTAVAGKLAGGKFVAVTVKSKAIGQEVKQGKSLATVESSKFVGPVPAPVTGLLVRANEKLASDPNLAVSDPYGEGWLVILTARNLEDDRTSLLSSDGYFKLMLEKLQSEHGKLESR
jgi:glycine cleavage system H protein